MIVLFTDFGVQDPYVGQVHAVLAQQAPGVALIDLFHAVPAFDIRAAAYLLPAYTQGFPAATVFLCVVDPGVGGVRRPVALKVDGRWYVGPDNGLFHILARRAQQSECREILWRPAEMSVSFHGRDLFAPVAARLARAAGDGIETRPCTLTGPTISWPDDLPRILYVDHYGNAVTGMRAAAVDRRCKIRVRGQVLHYAATFSAVPAGAGFWYENANGLIELSVNQGRADQVLGVRLGDEFWIVD